MNIDEANRIAVDRMMEARPVLVGVATASEVIPGFSGRQLLHAGPPIGWQEMSGPLRGAVIGASLFEGWATDEQEAVALAATGEIDFAPCHHHQAVGPMAGVICLAAGASILRWPLIYAGRWLRMALLGKAHGHHEDPRPAAED